MGRVNANSDRTSRDLRTLRILLRAIAIMGMAAVVACVMPHAWMDWFHRQIGLGALPDQPIVSYLTRSLSLFYVWVGVFAWYLCGDLERHMPMVRFLGGTGFGIGVATAGISLSAGLPWWWWASEAAFAILYFGAIYRLADRLVIATRE